MLVFLAGGCQSYERKALDLANHRTAFLERTPQSPQVQEFAASLANGATSDSVAFDLTDGAICAEAELVALVFNADLRLARLRAGVTQASAENAGLWEDPTIGVDLVRIVESTPNPWKVFSSLGLTIPISGRLEIEKQRAGVEHTTELARVAEREWMIRMDVRRAWTEWSALDAQLVMTREFVQHVDEVLAVVDRMEQVGEIARTEARLFRIEKITKVAELAVLESRAQEAELRLKQLMGLSPDAALRFVSTGIGPATAAIDELASPTDLESRNPAMVVAAADYEVAEKSLEFEVRKQYPDLHIGPGYGQEDGQNQVLLGLSLPIPILNANRQGIAEAQARRELARAIAETTLEQLVASARAAQVRLDAARRQREMLESQIVPLVDAQYADARQVAQLGEVSTLVLLESLSRQQEAKVKLIEARRDEALARIDVQAISGPAASVASAPSPQERHEASDLSATFTSTITHAATVISSTPPTR